jgi:hypothetical protein
MYLPANFSTLPSSHLTILVIWVLLVIIFTSSKCFELVDMGKRRLKGERRDCSVLVIEINNRWLSK